MIEANKKKRRSEALLRIRMGWTCIGGACCVCHAGRTKKISAGYFMMAAIM